MWTELYQSNDLCDWSIVAKLLLNANLAYTIGEESKYLKKFCNQCILTRNLAKIYNTTKRGETGSTCIHRLRKWRKAKDYYNIVQKLPQCQFGMFQASINTKMYQRLGNALFLLPWRSEMTLEGPASRSGTQVSIPYMSNSVWDKGLTHADAPTDVNLCHLLTTCIGPGKSILPSFYRSKIDVELLKIL